MMAEDVMVERIPIGPAIIGTVGGIARIRPIPARIAYVRIVDGRHLAFVGRLGRVAGAAVDRALVHPIDR
jgi:hypothetical protein